MTVSAQNAFLKLFEEPPQGVYFVLLCLSASMLLPTVRSRAQLLRTERCRDEDVREYLIKSSPRAASLARDGGVELDRIITAADGSIGEALRLLARSGGADRVRLASEGIINAIASRSGAAVMLSVSKLSSDRSDASDILEMTLDGLRELLYRRCAGTETDGAAELPLYDAASDASADDGLADSMSTREICDCITALCDARDRILHNANVRLALTSAALRLRSVIG